ncbi:periphilin-1 isoform X3 [Bombina bombina]|uniref:periphilin-1 isoform X3 n=1 Tax=Bombina bombina TaxID=8345 RepID=UPI00235A73D7|nr:periphilin-1 isoform X3 [Bombina bombina]
MWKTPETSRGVGMSAISTGMLKEMLRSPPRYPPTPLMMDDLPLEPDVILSGVYNPIVEDMYPRGTERGWNRGPNSSYHYQHDAQQVPALLHGHHQRSYSGGYNSYNRDYENHYSNYKEPRYPEDDRPYHEYRESSYYRDSRYGTSYYKEPYYKGGHSHRGRADSAHYHGKSSEPHRKKHSKNSVTPTKDHECTGRTTPTTKSTSAGEGESPDTTTYRVIHNPARTVVVLTAGDDSGDEAEKTAVTAQAAADKSPKAKCDVKREVKKNENEAPVSDTKQECTAVPKEQEKLDIKTEQKTEIKEEILPAPLSPKKEDVAEEINAVKRPFTEECDNSASENEREGKRVRTDWEPDSCTTEKAVQIPLLDGWTDVSTVSPQTPCNSEPKPASTSPVSTLSDTARALRTAFIVARKEEIELAFAQDCQTYALVASTLLKKDPSIETAIKSALRSTLQEIASQCVHELQNFIDRYDKETNGALHLDIINSLNDTNT